MSTIRSDRSVNNQPGSYTPEADTAPAKVLGCTDGNLFGLESWVVRQVGLIEAAAGFWTTEDV